MGWGSLYLKGIQTVQSYDPMSAGACDNFILILFIIYSLIDSLLLSLYWPYWLYWLYYNYTGCLRLVPEENPHQKPLLKFIAHFGRRNVQIILIQCVMKVYRFNRQMAGPSNFSCCQRISMRCFPLGLKH